MFCGIDPDLHDLAIGYWHNGKPAGADVIHVIRKPGRTGQVAVMDMVRAMWCLPAKLPKSVKGLAVEAQTLMRGGLKQHKRPQDIVILGNVAGAALALCAQTVPIEMIRFPRPEDWKGQIPKAVMQARLYSDLGWGYEMIGDGYARPEKIPDCLKHISAGQWKHVGDALLLAKWASENIK